MILRPEQRASSGLEGGAQILGPQLDEPQVRGVDLLESRHQAFEREAPEPFGDVGLEVFLVLRELDHTAAGMEMSGLPVLGRFQDVSGPAGSAFRFVAFAEDSGFEFVGA